MIVGIGIDLVQLRDIFAGGVEYYKQVILTDSELKLCENVPSIEGQAMFIAGRYAAKEAVFKALRKIGTDISYHDISVLNEKDGYSYIETKLPNIEGEFHLTMTHTSEYALAYVVIEKLK